MTKRFEEFQRELRKTVGARLLQARADVHRSQSEVLTELKRYGIKRTQGSLSQIEKGMRLPSLEIFCAMVRYYKASANYVLGLSDDAMSPADIEDELANARGEGRLGRAMNALSKEKQEQVITFAEYLLFQEAASGDADLKQWVAATEVLVEKFGLPGENSLDAAFASERPDLASRFGIQPKKKSVEDG